MGKTYKVRSRFEKTTASKVEAGQTVFLHVDRWNGSYYINVKTVECDDKKTVLTQENGQRHTVSSDCPVWVSEWAEVASVEP